MPYLSSEISQAQDRITNLIQDIYQNDMEYQEFVRLIMSTVGRGEEGDVGQRIQDEILVIQALMNYIKRDLDISVYWKKLNGNGITKQRLLNYDRATMNQNLVMIEPITRMSEFITSGTSCAHLLLLGLTTRHSNDSLSGLQLRFPLLLFEGWNATRTSCPGQGNCREEDGKQQFCWGS